MNFLTGTLSLIHPSQTRIIGITVCGRTMTKKRFASREKWCALQLLLKTWWWQYILMATLGRRRLLSCLIENFGALPTTCQEVGIICHPTLLKFLGDVMSVQPRRQGVASNATHLNLLLFRSSLSQPLQLTFVNCPSVCRSPLEKRWTISWSLSAVKPCMYSESLVKETDWTLRMLLLCFWVDASICLGCQKSLFVTMRPLSTLNF